MSQRIGALLANAGLVLASLLVTLAIAELTLRFTMDASRLVPNAPETPSLNQRRNELRFMERNQERNPETLSSHDPWLGWDAGRPRSTAAAHAETDRLAVAVGDSFVFGNEVQVDENFAALLNDADNGLKVLNMGVPGYGIDQSLLKLEHHGFAEDPDIVLFGIYVSDYERSTVAFSAGPKPVFAISGQTVSLTNQPVPSPASELVRIRSSLNGTSYLAEFVRNRLPGARQSRSEFYANGDRIVAHILTRLRQSFTEDQRLLIIHIPRGESFQDPDPFHEGMSERLLAIYQTLQLESVNLETVFLAELPAGDVSQAFYVVRESGSVGHLNPAGHQLVARAINALLGDTP